MNDETVMWAFLKGDIPGSLLRRCSWSTHGTILAHQIQEVDILGGGWLRYGFFHQGYAEHRYVAPHFDPTLFEECGMGHPWEGVWHLGDRTLHCKTCGSDGT